MLQIMLEASIIYHFRVKMGIEKDRSFFPETLHEYVKIFVTFNSILKEFKKGTCNLKGS